MLTKIPTGIESLDPILKGGFPSGSLVLLLGEIGSGDSEFVLTSCARLLKGFEVKDSELIMPGKVIYISFTRSRDDFMKEIALSFPDYYEIMQNNIQQSRFEFKDFSDAYFAMSFIPETWRSTSNTELSFESLKWSEEKRNLVDTLISYLDKNANGSLVIIDSLTALAQHSLEHMEWKDLILFLRGLQRASKKWDGLVYAVLSQGIFDKSKEEEISECTDGVVVFSWDKLGSSERKRLMYLKKFRGVMPGLDQDNIVNFEIQISSQKGFEISNIKRVRGR
ncbi:MAG: hypothetical protein OIN88_09630 [Candidatus Methanoperedens sp.]|nr:hypothetical protein [Candidatus Methanoperedens sp.]MCZ7359161.1 hypothetical protein [Candidatus Methanoperedens sp.]HLB72050.1 ATPase domain-containing protein [Candidatus Methanoperedens sp.]